MELIGMQKVSRAMTAGKMTGKMATAIGEMAGKMTMAIDEMAGKMTMAIDEMAGKMTMAIGEMTMPRNFKYRSVYLKGRPRHQKFDSFWRRHIPMDPGHRAKIFSPFDALNGFDELIASTAALSNDSDTLKSSASRG